MSITESRVPMPALLCEHTLSLCKPHPLFACLRLQPGAQQGPHPTLRPPQLEGDQRQWLPFWSGSGTKSCLAAVWTGCQCLAGFIPFDCSSSLVRQPEETSAIALSVMLN